ncbi:hypothetical protein [Corynebacterium sp. p3-SID1056]|nr:hypothetical protein [Corynebacterium sp. p3-SID1056]
MNVNKQLLVDKLAAHIGGAPLNLADSLAGMNGLALVSTSARLVV